jgi:transcriptional regulator with XRE-family HTH domain
MNTSTVKQRLERYLKEKKMSKTAFGKAIGVSSSYVTSIRSSISNEKVLVIRKAFPDLNTDWLLFGTGPMLKDGSETKNDTDTDLRRQLIEKNKEIADLKDTIARQAKMICDLHEKLADKKTSCLSN